MEQDRHGHVPFYPGETCTNQTYGAHGHTESWRGKHSEAGGAEGGDPALGMILQDYGRHGNNSTESCKVRRAFKENKNKSLESRGRRCEYTGESSEYGSFKELEEACARGWYLGLRQQGQGMQATEAER